jgi:hypothetical protein
MIEKASGKIAFAVQESPRHPHVADKFSATKNHEMALV